MAFNRGFTLVELSIVLVIIGLLIGGILVGQSIIDSVRISRAASDIRQYEIAVTQFYQKFKQIPGDSSLFVPAGNNNRLIANGGACASAPYTAYNDDETKQVWSHLSQSGMLKKTYSQYSDSTCGGNHDINTGVGTGVWGPFIDKVGGQAYQLNLTGTEKYPIAFNSAYTFPNYIANRVYFTIYPNYIDVPAFEQKLSATGSCNSVGTVGACNPFGLGKCNNDDNNIVNCIGGYLVRDAWINYFINLK